MMRVRGRGERAQTVLRMSLMRWRHVRLVLELLGVLVVRFHCRRSTIDLRRAAVLAKQRRPIEVDGGALNHAEALGSRGEVCGRWWRGQQARRLPPCGEVALDIRGAHVGAVG